MNKKMFLLQFMTEIWNNKSFHMVDQFVHPEYTIHLDTADPWEGQTLNHAELKERLKFSFNSFPDVHFEIISAIQDVNHVGEFNNRYNIR